MWARLLDRLVGPTSGEPFTLLPIEEREVDLGPAWRDRLEAREIDAPGAARWIETGLLCAERERLWFPIWQGVPILLPYPSALRDAFLQKHAASVARLGSAWRTPDRQPAPGERLVLKSFSTEWRDYDDSEVLWTWSVEERGDFFRDEIGADELTGAERTFIEIGCGLGLVTALAARDLGLDAIGVDLSLAALQASKRHIHNPLAHFVQASLWALPFARSSFDIVYSHGVLHHTHDTARAFSAVAALARPGGRTYVWLYGPGRAQASLLRRLAFPLEQAVRPVLARLPIPLTNLILYPIALAYWLLNRWDRARRKARQPYDMARALHAARDRFTPRFAHIQHSHAVRRWFEAAGFTRVHVLRPEEVGPASRESVALNVAVRGIRSWEAGSAAAAAPREGARSPTSRLKALAAVGLAKNAAPFAPADTSSILRKRS